MVGYNFGVHQAGVPLRLLLFLLVLHPRTIEVNRPYLRGDICRDRDSHG